MQLVGGGGGVEVFRHRLLFGAVRHGAGCAGIVGVVVPHRGHHAVARLVAGIRRGGRGRGGRFLGGIPGAQGAGSSVDRRRRKIELRLSRRLGGLGIFQRLGAVLPGVVLRFLQFADHLGQKVHQLAALLFHRVNAALQVLQAQAVGVLDLAGLLGRSLHHLAGLADGLLARKLVDRFGLEVGILQQLVGFLAGLAADAGGFFLRACHNGVTLGQHLLLGLLMLAALDAQRGVGVLGTLGQLFIFQLQIGVF